MILATMSDVALINRVGNSGLQGSPLYICMIYHYVCSVPLQSAYIHSLNSRPVSRRSQRIVQSEGSVRVRASGVRVRVRASGEFVSVSVRQGSLSVSECQGIPCPCPSVRMVRRPLLVPLLLLVGCAVRPDTESLVSAVPRHLSVCLSAVTPQCQSTACLDTCLLDQRDAASRRPEGHGMEAVQSPNLPPLCPEHWLRYDDSCYLIPDEKRTWMVANHACARLDRRARLASVHRDNIQNVTEILKMRKGIWRSWIGLLRISSDPISFGWIDGTPFDVSNWAPGEPSHENTEENCVHLWGDLTAGQRHRYKWNDNVCSEKSNFLCQINLAD